MIKFLFSIILTLTLTGCADALVKQAMIITAPFVAKAGKLFYDRNSDSDKVENNNSN